MSSCHGRRAVGSVIVDGSRKIGFSSQNSLSEASLVQESGIRNQESGIIIWSVFRLGNHCIHCIYSIYSISSIHSRSTPSNSSTEPLNPLHQPNRSSRHSSLMSRMSSKGNHPTSADQPCRAGVEHLPCSAILPDIEDISYGAVCLRLWVALPIMIPIVEELMVVLAACDS